MKLLLDENLPHDLRHELIGHDVFTARFMKYNGLVNGVLLARAAADGFEVLVTKDTTLQYEQDLTDLPIAVIVIRPKSNKWADLLELVPVVLDALQRLKPRTVVHVK